MGAARGGRRRGPCRNSAPGPLPASTARPLLGLTGCRDAARTIAEEISRMPSPNQVARQLPEYAE